MTIDVVVSELGDVGRFHSAKAVCAYAGLVPGVRQSSDRRKDLPITKAGSPLLRWALVEAAWRAVRQGAASDATPELYVKGGPAERALARVVGRQAVPCGRDDHRFDLLRAPSILLAGAMRGRRRPIRPIGTKWQAFPVILGRRRGPVLSARIASGPVRWPISRLFLVLGAAWAVWAAGIGTQAPARRSERA